MRSNRCVSDEFSDGGEQMLLGVPAFLQKSIGQQARRHACHDVLAADCDYWDVGEPAPNDGEKLEPRHVGHAEVGDDDVRGCLPQRGPDLQIRQPQYERQTPLIGGWWSSSPESQARRPRQEHVFESRHCPLSLLNRGLL